MRTVDYDRLSRWHSLARTWLSKATALLQAVSREATNADVRWAVGYNAEHLLTVALDKGEELVALLNPDADYDTLRRQARVIATKLRDHELAPKLAATDGRTELEAEAFSRKADEMRARA